MNLICGANDPMGNCLEARKPCISFAKVRKGGISSKHVRPNSLHEGLKPLPRIRAFSSEPRNTTMSKKGKPQAPNAPQPHSALWQ